MLILNLEHCHYQAKTSTFWRYKRAWPKPLLFGVTSVHNGLEEQRGILK